NPANTEINFEYPSSEKSTKLKLYDIRGRVVYEDIIPEGNGTVRGQIDTSAFSRGIYILKIDQGNTSTQKKVVLK
ncbi:MAG: T9SS type A sorting domain-containing protein, partial [Flavobacteriaceae bacterium]